MGREIRRVPASWEHPTDESVRGDHRPLLEGLVPIEELQAEWDRDNVLWLAGEHPDQLNPTFESARDCADFEEWSGKRPVQDDYMPSWPEAERTHYQMYEDTTEGSPISPVFATPEELARWLADNGASVFGDTTASYDEWLTICRGHPSLGLMVTFARPLTEEKP